MRMIDEAIHRVQIHLRYVEMIMNGQVMDKHGNPADDPDKVIAAGILLALNEGFKAVGYLDEPTVVDVCRRFYGERWLHPIDKVS